MSSSLPFLSMTGVLEFIPAARTHARARDFVLKTLNSRFIQSCINFNQANRLFHCFKLFYHLTVFPDERVSFDTHYNSTIQNASGDAQELLTLTQRLAAEKEEMAERHRDETKAFDTQLVMQIDQKVPFEQRLAQYCLAYF